MSVPCNTFHKNKQVVVLVIKKKRSQIGCIFVFKVLHVEEEYFILVLSSFSLVYTQDYNSPLGGKLQKLHLAVSRIPSWQMLL